MKIYLNWPADEVRGAEAMTREVAESIRAHGHDVTVGRDIWQEDRPHAERYRKAMVALLATESICNMVGYDLSWSGRLAARVARLLGVAQWAVGRGQ